MADFELVIIAKTDPFAAIVADAVVFTFVANSFTGKNYCQLIMAFIQNSIMFAKTVAIKASSWG